MRRESQEIHQSMTARGEELLELHRRLVQVPSVNRGDGSSAREDEVARVAAEYLRSCGVESRIVESAPGRGNLLASHRASEPGPTMLFISHSDVVPAGDETAWRFPPFSATVADGRIWGRGSNDCKMLVAAELFALGSIARAGMLPRGQIRMALGADEEAGGRFGFGWLAESEADFLRADLAVNEGGGAYLGRAADGEMMFTVGTGEKGRYEVVFTAKGPGTHASIPWGKANPVARIGELIGAIERWSGEPVLTSPVLRGLRAALGLEGELDAANLQATIDAGRKFSQAFYNSLMAQTRMTIVPTMLAAGDKSNAVPTRAELRCDARILPGQSREDLERAVREIAGAFSEVEFRIEETAGSSVSQVSPELRDMIERAIERAVSAKCRVVPTWCTGFTDSRFIRACGTPTIGFQLVEPGADPDRLGIHCIDESIEAGMLMPCALSLAHLALEFCGAAEAAKTAELKKTKPAPLG